MRVRSGRKIWLVALMVFVAVFIFTFLTAKFKGGEDVGAANLANFDAGYIMSDYQMGNYNSMSEADIQRFLTAKNPCNNTDYNSYVSMTNRYPGYSWHWANGHFVCISEERFGDGEVIGSGDTAAHIIWQAAQDYRINPQVLIVLLQKEQGLITDTFPHNRQYRAATGYGCPDTAACSSQYYGFKNQVRKAAAMFRTVLDGGWTNYPLGWNYVQYNPNSACGGSWINIRSLATSALYRYTPYQPNASALAAGYGTGDACGAYGNRNFYNYFEDWFGGITDEGWPSIYEVMSNNRVSDEATDLDLEYQAHIQHYGWLSWLNGGSMAGTSGYGLRMEALGIKLKNGERGIEYRAHIQDKGWDNYKRDGEYTGTIGEGLRIEAVQIRLTGDLVARYDVLYRTHLEGYGWTEWSKNDEVSGTTGEGRRMEAIQIKLIKKNLGNGPEYEAHVQDYGWMGWMEGAELAGTTGQAKRMEAIRILLPTSLASKGSIQYEAHVQDYGWMGWMEGAELAGTTGQAKRMEAIKIRLVGEIEQEYDVFYRVHIQEDGWQRWVKNGAEAGTTGQAKRMEALEIELVEK